MKLTSLVLRRCVTWPPCNSSFRSYSEREASLSRENSSGMVEARPRVLIYILRHDVRLSDNPIFHAASERSSKDASNAPLQHTDTRPREDSLVSQADIPSFTHLLPVYIFPAQ